MTIGIFANPAQTPLAKVLFQPTKETLDCIGGHPHVDAKQSFCPGKLTLAMVDAPLDELAVLA